MTVRGGMPKILPGRLLTAALACAIMPAASASDTSSTPVYEISESPATYLQTTLTHDIHRYASSAQLKDVVVLDNEGNALPFRITGTAVQVREDSERFALNFFPVSGGASPETWRSQGKTLVHVDDNAVSIVLNQNEESVVPRQAAPVDFYLLDLSQFEKSIDAIALEWQGAKSNQYLEVQVSGSSDLQTWSALAKETLVELRKDGEQLLRNNISLGLRSGHYDYLRLTIRDTDEVALTQVTAESKTRSVDPPPSDSWQSSGQLSESQRSESGSGRTSEATPVAAWSYERQENAPVTQLGIELGDIPYGDTVKLFSRADERQSWRLVHRGIWFNAQIGNDWQQSGAISVYANSDAHWRLELDSAMRDKLQPSLVFEHPLKTLQFIANHNPPYYLAVAADAAGNAAKMQVFSHLLGDGSVDWVDVDMRSLQPNLRSPVRGTPTTDWASLAFWAMLVLAVAVLVGFALRLYRQMQKAD